MAYTIQQIKTMLDNKIKSIIDENSLSIEKREKLIEDIINIMNGNLIEIDE